MNQKKKLICNPSPQLAAIYDRPILFRVKGHEWDWLFYEIDETDFSEGWLICPMSVEEVQDLEGGYIDIRSFFNNHREDCEIVYRNFTTGKFFYGDTIWDMNNIYVWNCRILPKTKKWFIDKNKIQYFDSTANPS